MTDDGWVRVMGLDELPDGRPTRTNLDGVAVLLYRAGPQVFAVGARCTHQGAPLDAGVVRPSASGATVTCPAHGSVFRLEDGRVMRPPAMQPIPVFDVRVHDGGLELRSRT
ncbi:MAG TPA: Rieske 2Fe-2S domain-containing protein [Actinomycetota bacterium]|nr:Rieske 2Fe-2S domain-containing protein [Actinomycetota bacterium]